MSVSFNLCISLKLRRIKIGDFHANGIFAKKSSLSEKKKQKFFTRLKSKYRLTILNENTFSEKFSVLLSPLNVISILLLFLVVFGGLVYAAIALTPLKQHVIPGYTDDEYRQDASYSRMMVDSMMKESRKKEIYLDKLVQFMNGEVTELEYPDSVDYQNEELLDDYEISEIDSVLRDKVSSENKYVLNPASERVKSLKSLFLYKPLTGTISGEFDPKIEHFGIDLIAPKNTVVNAVMDGTVIMSAYTTEDGHVIQVQHDHNLISSYKHNSTVFKKVGDVIEAGDAIAVIGDSGDHSEGPHLHFELWLGGVPVDPEVFFEFGE